MNKARRLSMMFLAVVAAIITVTPAKAQNADVTLAEGKFFERLDERGRVSGDIVMGVMIGPVGQADDPYFATADRAPRSTADVSVPHLPATPSSDPDQGEFCVRINSKDGRFEAENTYRVSGAGPFFETPFEYEGEYAPDLSEMKAVTLVKVGRCGERTETVVPSTWSDANLSVDERALHIFVNSAGNPTGLLVGKDEDNYIECAHVADATTLKYTSACVVPFDVLRPQKQGDRVNLTFFVARSLGEEEFDIAIALQNEGAER